MDSFLGFTGKCSGISFTDKYYTYLKIFPYCKIKSNPADFWINVAYGVDAALLLWGKRGFGTQR